MVMPHNERESGAPDAVRDGSSLCARRRGRPRMGRLGGRGPRTGQGWAGKPDPSDLIFLLKGMQNTWQEVWRQRLGQSERAYTSELRDFRNTWAHQGQFSTDDTYRMLDTAERLLSAFSAAEQLKLVQALKKDLQRQLFDEQARSERRKTAAKPTEGEPLKGLTPWREIITPHADVASGRFEQAEFAADLFQVATGNADEEYQIRLVLPTHLPDQWSSLSCHGGRPSAQRQRWRPGHRPADELRWWQDPLDDRAVPPCIGQEGR